ncbi:uncharacterized protein LOC142024898 isoform X2 [Carettochelys insculpta]|uniref:uncharacterized protein LOC142024898 isoform X2 n=1 Tax=Carettochelys insculpta TaxID=44489 RepID=UPI003EBF8FC5
MGVPGFAGELETIKKHLKGIETIYDKLDQLVSKDRKLLPRGAGEEAHKWLKKLADKTAILFQADRKDQRQRFEDAASQPQPHEPDVPGRKIAMKTELQGRKERGNLRESVAEKKQLTGSHVVRIHEQAPDPKYGLDHRSLDPVIHRISDTTEDAEPKVDVRSARNRFENMISATRPVVSGGSVTGVISPGGKVASQTRLQGPQERGGQVSEEQEGAGTRVCREAETPGPLTRHGSLPPADSHKQVDVTSLRRRFEDSSPPNPSAGSVGRGRGSVSPGRKAAGGVQRP